MDPKPKKQKISYKNIMNNIKNSTKKEEDNDKTKTENGDNLKSKGLGGGNFNKIDKI